MTGTGNVSGEVATEGGVAGSLARSYGVGSSNIAHLQPKKSQCSHNHILPSTTYDYNIALEIAR